MTYKEYEKAVGVKPKGTLNPTSEWYLDDAGCMNTDPPYTSQTVLIMPKDGTLQKIAELADKDNPMRVIEGIDLSTCGQCEEKTFTDYRCPRCGKRNGCYDHSDGYCPKCGQRLDWENKDAKN